MTNIMVEATDIVKTLGEGAGRVNALRGINMSLPGGQLTLLMGPSGSGKTTLLSVLGCMLSPTSGTVRIRGRSTTGLDSEALARLRRENVGFVFQSYHLFPTLTAAENVRLALDVRGDRSPGVHARAEAALATVGLADKANAFPRHLSGGQQQRVAIARAIVGDPAVVLADEPTAALDSENGAVVMTLLAKMAENPSCALFVVTHDPRIIPFCDRILHIEDGCVVADERRDRHNGSILTLKYARAGAA
jgi:putative ABC transport system ATP-binding protein